MSSLLTEREAAEQLSLSLATLRRRRCEGRPPKWIKIGASVRYRSEDLEAFIQSCTVGRGEEEQQAA
jgi:predicted DNA-binding transcriptional regulator AlpA